MHEGGCLCGAVRYRVKAAPVRASICHCRNCQRRTGSAFGIGAYFRQEDVEILQGLPTVYEYRSDESGRWLRTEFCPACGSTLTWTAEALVGLRAVAGGSFDDPDWLKIDRHGWTRSKQKWFVCPAEALVFEKGALQLPAKS
ncbi:MAG: GFA family protein [Burkholderiales bacterium]